MVDKRIDDNPVEGQDSSSADRMENNFHAQADDNSIALNEFIVHGDVNGTITIGHGFTAEQVSKLLTQITTDYQRKPFDGRCPYKGLDVFEEEDAELFFGRERLVEDLVNRVKESRAVFITGPSGSGKSSLVRAGLIHALKQGAIQDLHSERWLYETMKPGREPIKDLGLAFSRLKGPDLADYFQAHAGDADVLHRCAESVLSGRKDQHLVLFVDQFEEVFTQVNQEQERLAFISMLAHAGTVENGRVIVLFAMRSDFVSNCATYPALNELLSQQFRQIGAMQPEELVAAIALPAQHVGLPIEDELIARIINDMKGEPGTLPLMQFALKDLFDAQREQGGVIALTLEEYLQHGGIHKSLERHADKSFAELSEGEQAFARSIFSSLIEIGHGTQDTRRTALFDEIIPARTNHEDIQNVVQKLADARLIITDEQAGKDTVTISHEKLIEAWPWLKKLVNENRDVIALQNEITNDAKEWDDHGRDASYLYTGARLATAREQLQAQKLVLSGLAYDFVQAAGTRHRRSRIANRLGIATIGIALLAAALVFNMQANESQKIASTAQAASTEAIAQKLSAQVNANVAATAQAKAEEQAYILQANQHAALAQAKMQRQLDLSTLLSLEAFHQVENFQTYSALFDVVRASPSLRRFLHVSGDDIYSVAFSPDGKLLASGGVDGIIRLWDVQTGQPVVAFPQIHSLPINGIDFNADGRFLAAGSDDGTISIWSTETRQLLGQPLDAGGGQVLSIDFSLVDPILAAGNGDGTVSLWDVNTRQSIARLQPDQPDPVWSVRFSPDGKRLATGRQDGNIILWDVKTGRPAAQTSTGHTNIVFSLAFTRDQSLLASGSADRTIILWDIRNPNTLSDPATLEGHGSYINSVDFSPDGKTLASGSGDTDLILWDVETKQPIGDPLEGHSDWVQSVVFSPDGETLASGSKDGSVILWEVAAQGLVSRPLQGHNHHVFSVAFSPDGTSLASGSFDKTVILWDVATGKPVRQPLQEHQAEVTTVTFSPDGSRMASGSKDGTVILRNMKSEQIADRDLLEHDSPVWSLAFSPDGKILVSGTEDGLISLWNLETREKSGLLQGHDAWVSNLSFSPDGKFLASTGGDYTVRLWDVERREMVMAPMDGLFSLAFSPDGNVLAHGNQQNEIILFDMNLHQQIGQPLTGHTGFVNSVAFSPDGRFLASGSNDNTVILWDVMTQQPIGQPLVGYRDTVKSVAFSPDGKLLATGSRDNTITLWDMDPESWISKLCERVGRNFDQSEWAQYFPEEEYHLTCQQWPLGR